MKRFTQLARDLTKRFRDDMRGIAAIEFALVVPLMLVMYLGTIEISAAVSINRKVSRIASTIADLVTQQTEVAKTDLKGIMEIGEALLFPYDSDKPVITIVAIDVESGYPKGGKVVWARRDYRGTFDNGGYVKNADIDVPKDLRINGSFLIRVDTSLDYIPIVHWLIGDTVGTVNTNGVGIIAMKERYYLRPRLGADIGCTDC